MTLITLTARSLLWWQKVCIHATQVATKLARVEVSRPSHISLITDSIEPTEQVRSKKNTYGARKQEKHICRYNTQYTHLQLSNDTSHQDIRLLVCAHVVVPTLELVSSDELLAAVPLIKSVKGASKDHKQTDTQQLLI